MGKFKNFSSVLLMLSTLSVGSSFYYNNVSANQEEIGINSYKFDRAIELSVSENVSIAIIGITFNEDDSFNLKYTIKLLSSGFDVSKDLYNVSLSIFDGPIVPGDYSNRLQTFSMDAESELTTGQGTISNISVEDNLFESGKSYEAVIHWNEKGQDPNKLFYSTPLGFSSPDVPWPDFYLSAKSFYSSSIVRFNIDYENGATPIEQWDLETLIKKLHFTLYDVTSGNAQEVDEIYVDSLFDYAYIGSGPQVRGSYVWDWDLENTTMDFYFLIDDLQVDKDYEVAYSAMYNNETFETSQIITNDVDGERVKLDGLGNKFLYRPTISTSTRFESSFDSLDDYRRVYVDFGFTAPSEWADQEVLVDGIVDKGYESELYLTNSIAWVQIDNFKIQGTTPDEDVEPILIYSEDFDKKEYITTPGDNNATFKVENLEVDEDYTADITVLYETKFEGENYVTQTINFSTPDAIPEASLKVDDVYLPDLSPNPESSDWNEIEIKFLLEDPEVAWTFGPDVLLPGELFTSGNIHFEEVDGTDVVDCSLDETLLSNLIDGENTLNTNDLNIKLKSETEYNFYVDLNYSEKATGFFNKTQYHIDGRKFKTRNKVKTPSLKYTGYEYVDESKDEIKLEFEIQENDLLNSLTDSNDISVLDLVNIYSSNLGFNYIKKDGVDVTSELSINDVALNELRLYDDESKNVNTISISGLETDSEYSFEASIDWNDEAVDESYGWMNSTTGGSNVVSGIFDSSTKFTPFKVDAILVDDSTHQQGSDLSTWESTVIVEAPTGSSTEAGIDNEDINSSTTYKLTDEKTGEVFQTGDIAFTDKDYETGMSSTTIQFTGLNPNTVYTFETTTTFDENYISSVSDDKLWIGTGKNDEFVSGDFVYADWSLYSDDSNPETNNIYDDISINLKLKEDAIGENLQSKLSGIKSISLADSEKIYSTVDSQTAISSLVDEGIDFQLGETLLPGEELSGFHFDFETDPNFNEIEDIEITGTKLLPYLIESDISNENISINNPTSITVSLDISEYNNIERIDFSVVSDDDGGRVIYSTSTTDGFFDVAESGSKTFELTLPDKTLNPNSNYHNEYRITYKDVVENNNKTVVGKNYSTPRKEETFNSSYALKQGSTHSIDLEYDYSGYVSSASDVEHYSVKSVSLDLVDANTNATIIHVDNALNKFSPSSSSGIIEDYFDDEELITPGKEYALNETIIYNEFPDEDVTIVHKDVSSVKIVSKERMFNSSVSVSQENENSITMSIDYSGLILDGYNPKYEQVVNVEYKIHINKGSADEKIYTYNPLLEGGSESESGTWTHVLTDPEYIYPEQKVEIIETVEYANPYIGADGNTQTEIVSTLKYSDTVKYDDSILSINTTLIDSNSIYVDLWIDKYNGFLYNDYPIYISLKNSSMEYMTVVYDSSYSIEPIYKSVLLDGTVKIDNELLSEDSKHFMGITDDVAHFTFDLYGIYLEKGDLANLELEYNGLTYNDEVVQEFGPHLDPNSMEAQGRYEYSNGKYLYEVKIDHSEDVDLQSEVRVATNSTTLIDDDGGVRVVGEEYVTEDTGFEFNKSNMYLLVDEDVAKTDWRNLDFLVGNYLVYSDNGFVKDFDFTKDFLYFVDDYDMLPIPKEPLTFGEWLLIIIIILAIILIIWIIIYKYLKYNNIDKWYKYALSKADYYYTANRKIIETYGWTHRYNDWLELSEMTLPKLKEYALKMNIPIPYKTKKEEMVDILSLLTDAELIKVRDFTDHIIDIEDQLRDELLHEFQNSKSKPVPPRRKFNYIIDKAHRIETEGTEFKKNMKDYLVDFYIWFERNFINGTDWVLINLGLKNRPVKDIDNSEDIHWEESVTNEIQMDEGMTDVSFEISGKDSKELSDAIDESLKEDKKNNTSKKQKEPEINDDKQKPLDTLTKSQLIEIASEVFEEESLKPFTKKELIEIIINEGIVDEKYKPENNKIKPLETLTKAQLIEIASEVFEEESLKPFTKNELITFIRNEELVEEEVTTETTTNFDDGDSISSPKGTKSKGGGS